MQNKKKMICGGETKLIYVGKLVECINKNMKKMLVRNGHISWLLNEGI
jgi:hypothetical protein